MYTAKLKIHQIQTLRNQNQTMRLHLILILAKLSHCYTLTLPTVLCCFVSLFYRAFLLLLNLIVSLQRRLVRSAVAFHLFVISPARRHRLVLDAVIQFVCLHPRLERVWPVDVVVFQLPKLVVSHHRLVLLVVFRP